MKNTNINSILNNYSYDIVELNITKKNIYGILNFEKFNKLQKINCSSNFILEIKNFPPNLLVLNCDYNL